MSTSDNPADGVVEIPLTVERIDTPSSTTGTSAPGDVGDAINPTAFDPTADEITDPNHTDHVDPFPGATPTSEGA